MRKLAALIGVLLAAYVFFVWFLPWLDASQ
jgi:hypothetical protein